MKIERVFNENSNIKLENIVKSIIDENLDKSIDEFFKSLNIKEIDSIIKGDFTLC
ncbi:hypothetical protein P5E44_06775 [Clostridium perfringens]|nr:hypothetical protein [Clostridium perfringens]